MNNNIALITALFNEKGANFYKDIYFPIIRYSLISLFNEHEGEERYFKIQDLQDFIKSRFYIEIPVVVLRNSVVALRDRTQSELIVDTMGTHNDSIYIKRIVDPLANDSIDIETKDIEDKFSLLENLFQQYLNAEHLDSNTNLYDFISDYEEECYSLIVGENPKHVDGIDANYTNTARFVDWLNNNRTDLYHYFEDIVWGAVISAFLRRKQFEFSIKPNEKVCYYLDSALVLALLGLDTEYNVTYARDVIRNVYASGSIIKVHCITVREVTRILDSVIKDQGPRFGSAIAFGFDENNLSLSDIVTLKNSLESKLTSEYKIIIENIGTQLITEVERRLENHKNVLFLKEKWGGSTLDKMREKHDVFMCETVVKMNDGIVQPEKLKGFFVTLNRDLIELYHKPEGLSSVITPGNVVLKLWIHGAQIVNIGESVLTELLSRCMALAQTDARHKIKLFYKYRKKENITEQDAKDMYSCLIYRSNNVIMKFEELEQVEHADDSEKDTKTSRIMSSIIEEMHEEAKDRHQLFNEQIQVTQRLQANMALLEESIKVLSNQKSENEGIIAKLMNKDSDNKLVISQLKKEIEKRDREHELLSTKHDLIDKKKNMESERNKSVNMASYWIVLLIDLLLVLAFFFFSYVSIKNYCDDNQFQMNIQTVLAGISFCGFLFRIRDSYLLKPFVKYSQCRNEQITNWDENHPEYGALKVRINEIERELQSLAHGQKK